MTGLRKLHIEGNSRFCLLVTPRHLQELYLAHLGVLSEVLVKHDSLVTVEVNYLDFLSDLFLPNGVQELIASNCRALRWLSLPGSLQKLKIDYLPVLTKLEFPTLHPPKNLREMSVVSVDALYQENSSIRIPGLKTKPKRIRREQNVRDLRRRKF